MEEQGVSQMSCTDSEWKTALQESRKCGCRISALLGRYNRGLDCNKLQEHSVIGHIPAKCPSMNMLPYLFVEQSFAHGPRRLGDGGDGLGGLVGHGVWLMLVNWSDRTQLWEEL